MYALFAICNTLSPSRLDDQILSNAKERYADQIAKMSLPFTAGSSAASAEPTTPAAATMPPAPATTAESEAIAAYKELFLYACPKFITANPPPYHDPDALSAFINDPPEEPAARHLDLFLGDVRARAEVPTLRSYLKLYTSLDASKLAGFLERDEEELVQLMMVMKGASRGISRVNNEGTLLDGQVITTTDLDFVINEVRNSSTLNVFRMLMKVQNMVHVVESVINRKYGGWFVRNTEHSQRVFDALRASPLPISKVAAPGAPGAPGSAPEAKAAETKLKTGPAWGGAGRKVEFAV